ncbi:MAG: succinate dehydrogenase, hydrophobic membrane anchor protein [Dongiaceae bacterium]
MGRTGRFRSELGRVEGLGSAKEGVTHWWAQRVTAVALVPLTMWLVATLVTHAGADHADMVDWLSSPLSLGLMTSVIAATFHHAQLGLQVAIEDYIQHEAGKILLILTVKLASLALGLTAIVALLVIAFGQ